MKSSSTGSTVTARDDPRITRAGAWLRRYKLDELPQFVNIAKGQMSLLGPRPDVPGYADRLTGEERVVLSVKPGISGPATVFFRDEESLLQAVEDPVKFNDTVIYPLKVKINQAWIEEATLADDIRLMMMTARAPRTLAPIRTLIEKWADDASGWPEWQTAIGAVDTNA